MSQSNYRIVQTTWTDGGPHQPLPPPDDPQGDEIERLTKRVAELEAKLELCVKLAAMAMERCDQDWQAYHENTTFWRWMLDDQTPMPQFVTIVRAAIQSPEPRS
jgi:hypothetical protein